MTIAFKRNYGITGAMLSEIILEEIEKFGGASTPEEVNRSIALRIGRESLVDNMDAQVRDKVNRLRSNGLLQSLEAAGEGNWVLSDSGIAYCRARRKNQREDFARVLDGDFDPAEVPLEQSRIERWIKERRGQAEFRSTLIQAYQGRCAISGCCEIAVLEAAHILPYKYPSSHHVQNGVLMRSDFHTLFDLGKLEIRYEAVSGTYSVWLAQEFRSSEYGPCHGRTLDVPADVRERPSHKALELRDKLLFRN